MYKSILFDIIELLSIVVYVVRCTLYFTVKYRRSALYLRFLSKFRAVSFYIHNLL